MARRAAGKAKGKRAPARSRAPRAGIERINPGLAGLVRPLAGLKNDPQNARLHPERNLQALGASLARFGQQKPVVALRDGTVIAGNGLLSAAQAAGWRKLAVLVLDTDDRNEARAYALADNRTAELSKWDHAGLAAALRSLPEVGDLGWDPDELRMLLAANWQPGEAQDGGLEEHASYRVVLTTEQYEVVMRACAKVRTEAPGPPEMSDGRCLELVCAEYLS